MSCCIQKNPNLELDLFAKPSGKQTKYRIEGPALDDRTIHVVCRFGENTCLVIITVYAIVRYLENLRQNDQEILNKGGWGRAKRAPSAHIISEGSLRGVPATHTFDNLFGSGLAGLGLEHADSIGARG